MSKPPINSIEEITAQTLKHALFRYFYKGDLPNTKQFPLDALFEAERRSYSVLHGLTTSLGTGLWQTLAKRIATECGGFEACDPAEIQQPKRNEKLEKIVDSWIAKRNEDHASIELEDYIKELKGAFPQPAAKNVTFERLQKSLGADLLLRKGQQEWAIESKTCQINAGGGREFSEKLMRWYAYRYFQKGSQHNFTARLAIPYNPYQGDWFEEQAGRIHPLTECDIWVESAYWDFLSDGKNTWQKIQGGFQKVSQSKPLMTLYREAFGGSVSDDFELRVLGMHIGCKLLHAGDQSDSSKHPRWRCYSCKSEFLARASHLWHKTNGTRKIEICPNCKNPLLPSV